MTSRNRNKLKFPLASCLNTLMIRRLHGRTINDSLEVHVLA